MKTRPYAIAALISFGLASALASPAHATTFDASGVEFDFGNPGNADLLANANPGQFHRYLDVAAINGTSIDAVVSVESVSDALVSTGDYQHVNQERADILNGLNDPSEATITPGCYSNSSYVADPENYFVGEFVAADRLPGGRVSIVDEDQGSDSDRGINNYVDICTYYDDPSVPSSMVISIEFFVNDDPVILENVVLNVQDIDGGQSVEFSSPRPSTYELTSSTGLEVTGNETFTRFYGAAIANDDPDFAVDVRYDSVSSLTYEFGFSEGRSGGGLEVLFETFVSNLADSESLAPTGANDGAPGTAALGGLAFVAAGLLVARRLKRV